MKRYKTIRSFDGTGYIVIDADTLRIVASAPEREQAREIAREWNRKEARKVAGGGR